MKSVQYMENTSTPAELMASLIQPPDTDTKHVNSIYVTNYDRGFVLTILPFSYIAGAIPDDKWIGTLCKHLFTWDGLPLVTHLEIALRDTADTVIFNELSALCPYLEVLIFYFFDGKGGRIRGIDVRSLNQCFV